MFKASARLSVSVILLVVVFPPKSILSPVAAASTLRESALMSPTFVIFPSETERLVPTRAANVPAAALFAPMVVPSIAPLSTLTFVIALLPKSEVALMSRDLST